MRNINIEQLKDMVKITPAILEGDTGYSYMEDFKSAFNEVCLALMELDEEARIYKDGVLYKIFDGLDADDPSMLNYIDSIELGTVPSDEECEQVGNYYNRERAINEAYLTRDQLIRMFGPPPADTKFRVSGHPYVELHVVFSYKSYASIEYALQCEGEFPEKWDKKALPLARNLYSWMPFKFNGNLAWGTITCADEWRRILNVYNEHDIDPYSARFAAGSQGGLPNYGFYKEHTDSDTLLKHFLANNMRVMR